MKHEITHAIAAILSATSGDIFTPFGSSGIGVPARLDIHSESADADIVQMLGRMTVPAHIATAVNHNRSPSGSAAFRTNRFGKYSTQNFSE